MCSNMRTLGLGWVGKITCFLSPFIYCRLFISLWSTDRRGLFFAAVVGPHGQGISEKGKDRCPSQSLDLFWKASALLEEVHSVLHSLVVVDCWWRPFRAMSVRFSWSGQRCRWEEQIVRLLSLKDIDRRNTISASVQKRISGSSNQSQSGVGPSSELRPFQDCGQVLFHHFVYFILSAPFPLKLMSFPSRFIVLSENCWYQIITRCF